MTLLLFLLNACFKIKKICTLAANTEKLFYTENLTKPHVFIISPHIQGTNVKRSSRSNV